LENMIKYYCKLSGAEWSENVKIKNSILGCLVVGILTLSYQLTPVKAESRAAVFFPKGIFSENGESDRLNAARLAKYLLALQEPSLYELKGNPKAVIFRFLCLRTFNQPFAIRIEAQTNGTGVVCFKATDGTGAYKPGNLVTEKTVKLNKKQMQTCMTKLERADFWSLATKEANLDGCDGAQWVLEGVKNGKYQLVERQSPDRGGVRRLGLYFLKLSREKIRDLD
jgi:coenzyme F420-reducing hydrogenase delta subunit